MLGAIIGDIVGSTRELKNERTTRFELLPPGSRFTDDTVMTLAVAEWLMTDSLHRPETLVKCMQTLGRRYLDAGYGCKFFRWLLEEDPHPYNSYGNGSAMRVSPVGLYAETFDEALELARITASVSHNHPEGIKGAQAIAVAVFMFRNGVSPNEIKRTIESQFGYNLDANLDDLREHYQFDASCQGSVPVALMSFLRYPHNCEKALRMAISIGGDSDTIGAMTCSISCANNSNEFPHDVVKKCREILPKDLREINDRFEQFLMGHRVEKNDWMRDKMRGCLVAGAAGDALGYAVEFSYRDAILYRYGSRGITKFSLDTHDKALISDDTQMTLFTANGLLFGNTRLLLRGIGSPLEYYVQHAYMDWYLTQTAPAYSDEIKHYTWLSHIPQLYSCRAPGNTCMSAIRDIINNRVPENNSKGCGGIMRVAPMALFAMSWKIKKDSHYYSPVDLSKVGAEIARITHKHPLGFLPAAMLTHLIYNLLPFSPDEAAQIFSPLVEDSIRMLNDVYPGEFLRDKLYLADLTRKALALAYSDTPDHEAIRQLGEGWTAEETWAIAVYCAARHIDSVEDAIIAAVNHDGDSDSTGSVCGNIMGAIFGYEAIRRARLFCPEGKKLEKTLELHDVILAIADDLFTNCILNEYDPRDTPENRRWRDRYIYMKPTGISL